MKVKGIKLINFRLFEDLEITLPSTNFIIFIGVNGCGKSTLLDSMAMILAHIIGQLKSPRDRYSVEYSMRLSDITNETNFSAAELRLIGFDKPLKIKVSKKIDQKGFSYDFDPKTTILHLKEKLKADNIFELPLFAYYSLNRTINIENANGKSKSNNFNRILNGYNNSISSKISAFKDFKNWFIYQENLENERKVELKKWNFELTSLKLIRKAIEDFLSLIHIATFKDLKVSRYKESNLEYKENGESAELIISKNGKEVKIEQLSSGEKMVILLVADIARRLIILNNSSESSLTGQGIILIDEIELHLHPKWQRRIIPALTAIFPNIQFLATTHSPQILSSVSDKSIIVLHDGSYFSPSTNPIGRDSNGILEEIFDTSDRPQEVDTLIDEIFLLLSSEKINFSEVESKLTFLRTIVGRFDPILVRIENLIKRNKILNN